MCTVLLPPGVNPTAVKIYHHHHIIIINHLVQGFSQFMHSLFLSNNPRPKLGTHFIPHNSPAFFEQPTPFPHIPFIHCTSPYAPTVCQ
jgi:hypothetical protein